MPRQAQGHRLRHRDVVREGELLNGGRLQLHTTSGRAVGLGQHQGNVESRIMQRFQCNRGEFGRAGKDDVHAMYPAREKFDLAP